jgi:uncharacterized protein
MIRIGVISDTHGLLRPEAITFLQGSDQIIHGGDIGPEAILQRLARLAPVIAVRGNNDTEAWAQALPESRLVQVAAVRLYVIHDLAGIDMEPQAAGIAAVISGHSHRPSIHERDGILYVNPGSAGPRRFKLPIAVAELLIEGSSVTARIVELPVAGGAGRARGATRMHSAASLCNWRSGCPWRRRAGPDDGA